MNEYELRQERRRQRLERAAGNAKQEADRRFGAARNEVAGIPPGQPILVGHHSEKRHRRALEKHDSHMRKGFGAMDRARELAHRAEAVGTGGISSDDPDAVLKLREKLAELEAKRDEGKALNAAYRKRDNAKLLELSGRTLEQWDAAIAGNYSWDKRPMASYSLTNLGARIRATQKRIAQLEQLDALQEQGTTTRLERRGATIIGDPGENRVLVRFPARLSRDDYKTVRSAGFVWSPTRDAFVRKYSAGVLEWARRMVDSLKLTEV